MSTPDMSEWHEERRRRRLEAFQARRPAELRHKGDLHDDIADWGSRLFDHTARNLILLGPTGTGKTWSMWEVLERALTVSYPGHIMLLAAAEWQEIVGPPVDRERLRQMRDADVLGLDDLGSIRINDWTKDVLGPVIDWRWAPGLPIVVTSNMSDLITPLGDRIASRLGARATVVALTGKDRRAG